MYQYRACTLYGYIQYVKCTGRYLYVHSQYKHSRTHTLKLYEYVRELREGETPLFDLLDYHTFTRQECDGHISFACQS